MYVSTYRWCTWAAEPLHQKILRQYSPGISPQPTHQVILAEYGYISIPGVIFLSPKSGFLTCMCLFRALIMVFVIIWELLPGIDLLRKEKRSPHGLIAFHYIWGPQLHHRLEMSALTISENVRAWAWNLSAGAIRFWRQYPALWRGVSHPQPVAASKLLANNQPQEA